MLASYKFLSNQYLVKTLIDNDTTFEEEKCTSSLKIFQLPIFVTKTDSVVILN